MSYTAKFKLSVIATEIRNRAAARKFYLNECRRANLHTAATRCRHQPSFQGRDTEALV